MVNIVVKSIFLPWIFWCCHASDECEVKNLTKEKQDLQNVTSILNALLNNYNKRLRPGYDKGVATNVIVDINIRSMGPISEKDMTYKMDAYFRQRWEDDRLKFSGPSEQLAVSIKTLERMWIPDTYFYNGLGSYLHTITTPNKLLRIYNNGSILYSMRLTIKASCPMYLHYFPLDQQSCPLHFGSYAYTHDQLTYQWKDQGKESISTAKDMRLSQFDLVSTPVNSLLVSNHSGTLTSGTYSTLKVNFVMNRHMGYFLIQVYVPCSLIVVLSWVSFWINREATADRISLGVLTELTLTTLSFDTRDDLPKVAYPTALDWFIILCYVFVTATLLEFAGVHYFTKIGSGEVQHGSDSETDASDEDSSDEVDEPEVPNRMKYIGDHVPMQTLVLANQRNTTVLHSHPLYPPTAMRQRTNPNSLSTPPKRTTDTTKSPRQHPREHLLFKFLKCLIGSAKYRKLMTRRSHPSGVNTVSRIDKISRVLFPVCFTFLSVIYWIAFSRYVDVDILKMMPKMG